MAERNLTEGGVLACIAKFSLPYLLSYFMQILYGLADLFVVGRFCGVESITAVSIGSQVMHMLTVIVVGLAMGTTVVIARAVGAGDSRTVSRAVGNTVTLFISAAVVSAVVLLLSVDGIVRAFSTPEQAVEQTSDYLAVCFAGIPFIVAYNVIASVFRGMGDSKSPMYFVAVACAVNVALDFFLVGSCGMGAEGAAFATVISQAVSVVVSLFFIMRFGVGGRIDLSDFKPQRDIMDSILKIGLPVSLQDGFVQIAFMVITVIANRRGLVDAAAVGIVEKIIGVLFLVPSAMLSTVSAMAAQNIGAGKIDRAESTLVYAVCIAVFFGTVSAVILQFFASGAVGLFTDETEVIVSGSQYLKGYVWDCVFAGVHFCFSGFFCACGLSMISFAHNLVSILLVRIPMTYYASLLYPATLFPMGLASPAGSLCSVAICVAAYVWLTKGRGLGLRTF